MRCRLLRYETKKCKNNGRCRKSALALHLSECLSFAGIWARAAAIPLRQMIAHVEQHTENHVIITGHGMAGSVAACLALRLIKEGGAHYVSRIRCVTFGQVPFELPQELTDSQFKHVPQIKNRFISYILPSDSVPLQVSLLLTENAEYTGGLSKGNLQQRLSSIFLSHVMSCPRASTAWATFIQAQQVAPNLRRIAPVGEIYSVSGLAQDEVTGTSWLDFARQQVSHLKTTEAHAVQDARSLLDYSIQFGPFLRSVMKERSSTISVCKLGAHPHVDRVQVFPVGPQDVFVRIQGENLGTACHISVEVQNGGTAYRATTQQFLAPDVWNVENGFSGTFHQASWADLIVHWSVPITALKDESVMMMVKVESVLSDVHQFSVTPCLVDPADWEDKKRWSGELDELQTEDHSLSSLTEDLPQVPRGLRLDAAILRQDSLRSDGSAAKKKKSSGLELENKRLKKQLEEQTSTAIELSQKLALLSGMNRVDSQPFGHGHNERDDQSGNIAKLALRSEMIRADLQAFGHGQNERGDQSGIIAKIRDVDLILKALHKLFVNLPLQSSVPNLERVRPGGEAVNTSIDGALDNLMDSAHEFRKCVDKWMEHFTTVLSLSKDEIMHLFEDQHTTRADVRTLFQALQSSFSENSFLKHMVNEMRIKLGKQEAQTDLIREQRNVIAILNETCRSCLEELNAIFEKESQNEQIRIRYLENVEGAQKFCLRESLAKTRGQLEQQLSMQEEKMQAKTALYLSNSLRLHAVVQELTRVAKDVQDNVQEPAARASTLRLQGAVQEVLEISHSLHGTVRGHTSGFSSTLSDIEPPSQPIPPAPITSRLQEEIDALQKALADREKEIMSLKEQVQEREEALTEANASNTSLTQPKAELESRLLASPASTADPYEEILDLKKKLTEAHEVADGSQKSAQDAMYEVIMLKKKVQEMKTQLCLKFSDVQWSTPFVPGTRDASDYEEEITNLKQKLRDSVISVKTASEYEQELSKLRQKLQKYQAEQTMTESVYSKLREEWSHMRAELLQREEMAKNIDRKSQEPDVAVLFQQVSSRIQEEVGRLRSELLGDERDKKRDGEMLSYGALQAQLRAYETQIRDATVKLDTSGRELAEKKKAMEVMEEALGVHKDLLSQSEKQVAVYRKQLATQNVESGHANKSSTGQDADAESTSVAVEDIGVGIELQELVDGAQMPIAHRVVHRRVAVGPAHLVDASTPLQQQEIENLKNTLKEYKEALLMAKTAVMESEHKVARKDEEAKALDEEVKALRQSIASRNNNMSEEQKRTNLLPVSIALTIGGDFDEMFGDPNRTIEFDRTLQEDVSTVLDVPLDSVQVLCHQRGSIIAEVVLFGDETDETQKAPAQLAQDLVRSVRQMQEGIVRTKELGRCIKSAEVRGPIARPVCTAVQAALSSLRCAPGERPVVARNQDIAQASTAATEIAYLRSELEEMTKRFEVERHNRRQEFWESVMLQVIEATDRELDREMGLVSPGRTLKRVREGLDGPQFENGITTLEDIKRALPQLQGELLKRRRQIELLRLTDKDKTARLEQLHKGMEALSVKLGERTQLQWEKMCLRLLHSNFRAWIRRELIDDVERNRAGEKVAAEMLASAEAKIDELGAALTEQTDQKVKLMETKEFEAAVLFKNEMISLKEQLDASNREREALLEEDGALKTSLDKLQGQLDGKSRDLAATVEYLNSMSTYIDLEMMDVADTALEAVELAAEHCGNCMEELKAKLSAEIAARGIVWDRLGQSQAMSVEAASGIGRVMSRLGHWRHRLCNSMGNGVKRQILRRGFLAWAAWSYWCHTDRKLGRANNRFLRYQSGVMRSVYRIWHDWMLQERSNIRKANTIMDRADRLTMRKVLSAWKGPWAQRMRLAKHDAEQFVTSLMVCVEEAGREADATIQMIHVSL
jgi:hypothetical protein